MVRKSWIAGMAALMILGGSSRGYGIEKADLIQALKPMYPVEAEYLEKSPAKIEEEPLAFLAPYVAAKVSLLQPPHFPTFSVVYKAGGPAYVVSRGEKDYELFREAAQPKVQREEDALGAALWYLRTTQGRNYWQVGKVEDIPFAPAGPKDEKRAEEIQEAKRNLEGKIQPPAVKAVQDEFEVRVCAVQRGTLFRYVVKVTRTGRIHFQTETLAEKLPVSWVWPG